MSTFLKNARVLLGITGGIAAYKSAELCRLLQKAGAEVRVIMTDSAQEFITPLTFETLTNHPVYTDVFEPETAWEIEHVAWARWGQVFVVAPATANSLAKMAQGLADDALSTTALAFRGPVVVAPAMNTVMWDNAQTRRNLAALGEHGARIVQPGAGELACGDVGAGRLAELEKIVKSTEDALANAAGNGPLKGKNVLITAGPTVEPIDPVRHLSNSSTGRMGMALAAEAVRRGARVTLVCGPTHLVPPTIIHEVVAVGSAREMRDAVIERLADQDICVFSAAVADYTPARPATEKMKKESGSETFMLELIRTPDVAAEANALRHEGQTFVGFAAETHDLEKNARDKMERKGFDCMVANLVTKENPAFAAKENAVLLLAPDKKQEVPTMPKEQLASPVWDFVGEVL